MTDRFEPAAAGLLLALQRGLPLEPRPFAALAAQLDLTEDEVLEQAAAFVRAGLVRRFGAVFDARGLGYDSTLCAVDVPEADVERVAALLQPHTGITHCYQRAGAPALWFTLTAPADALAGDIAAAARRVAPWALLNLPTRRTFKIGVVLDVRRQPEPAPTPAAGPSRPADSRGAPRIFSERERELVRRLQADIPLTAEPWTALAGELHFKTDALLTLLNAWQQAGILRRVGLVPYHRELGFAVNGMCVWRADPQGLEAAGRVLAAAPEVTHCYERVMNPGFPFNLFAMLHAATLPAAEAALAHLTAAAGLSGGRMLVSVREFKKTSPRFFTEESLKPDSPAENASRT